MAKKSTVPNLKQLLARARVIHAEFEALRRIEGEIQKLPFEEQLQRLGLTPPRIALARKDQPAQHSASPDKKFASEVLSPTSPIDYRAASRSRKKRYHISR